MALGWHGRVTGGFFYLLITWELGYHIELPPFYRVHTQFPMPGVSPLFSGSGATVH